MFRACSGVCERLVGLCEMKKRKTRVIVGSLLGWSEGVHTRFKHILRRYGDMRLTAAVLCVALAAQRAQAMHYAHFVRALVPRSWLVLAVQDSIAEDREENPRRHFYQGHALRPWNDKADGLMSRLEFFTDYPFELPDFSLHEKNHRSRPAQPDQEATHLDDEDSHENSRSRVKHSSRAGDGSEDPLTTSPHPRTTSREEQQASDASPSNQHDGSKWRKEHDATLGSRYRSGENHSGRLPRRPKAPAVPGCCSTEGCSWTVTLQARSLEEQDTYMEQHTISASRTAYQIDECVLLRSVVARRVRQSPQQLTCFSSFDDDVFVSASITVQTLAGLDVESVMGLEQHTMLTPVGEVTVESACQDSAAVSEDAKSELSNSSEIM